MISRFKKGDPLPDVAPTGGYTLVELLVVLGILSLIAVFGVPAASHAIAIAALQADTRTLMVELRKLATQAVNNQETVTLSRGAAGGIDVSAETAVTLANKSSIALAPGVEHIVFFPDGSSSGGALTVRHGAMTAEVDVAWLSGEITLRREAP